MKATWWRSVGLLGLALFSAASVCSCRGMQERRIPLIVTAGVARGISEDAAENGQLHRAVVQAIFFHPALPYAFGGHGGHLPQSDYLRTAELTVALNQVLRDNVRAMVLGVGMGVELQVSRRTGVVTASWSSESRLWPLATQTVLFDLSRVAGAFAPHAELTAEAVARGMVVRVEEP